MGWYTPRRLKLRIILSICDHLSRSVCIRRIRISLLARLLNKEMEKWKNEKMKKKNHYPGGSQHTNAKLQVSFSV